MYLSEMRCGQSFFEIMQYVFSGFEAVGGLRGKKD